MLAVLVINTKGGCGKTTIATCLAAAFAARGHATALADVDRQKSAREWLGRRPATAPRIESLDWRRNCEPVPPRVERLVIDAPAALPVQHANELLRHADLVLVPILPSILDVRGTTRFLGKLAALKPVRKGRARIGLVANRVRRRSRSSRSLDDDLATMGHPVLARLSDRSIYAELAARGLGPFDPGVGAGPSVRAEWQPLLAALEARLTGINA